MKLKLKVNKTLKRDLKDVASKVSMERMDYVMDQLMNHLETNKDVWEGKTESYPQLVEDRKKGLEDLKLAHESSELSKDEQLAELKKYYQEHHMYRVYHSKKRKFENIIINLEDDTYYALCLISESNEQSVETYTVNFLEQLVKQP